jgi:hypothetical protein
MTTKDENDDLKHALTYWREGGIGPESVMFYLNELIDSKIAAFRSEHISRSVKLDAPQAPDSSGACHSSGSEKWRDRRTSPTDH